MTSADFDRDDSGKPDLEGMLDMAINTAQEGNRDSARVMLRRVLNEDRFNDRAMLWLAKLAQTREERKEWLRRVLIIDPNNTVAQDGLKQMAQVVEVSQDRSVVIFGIIAGVVVFLGIVVVVVIVLLN